MPITGNYQVHFKKQASQYYLLLKLRKSCGSNFLPAYIYSMDTRRSFLKKASFISGGTGLLQILPASIQKAMAIDPAPGSTYLDAEHIVFLMQENRSFDHTFGTLQGVRGYNDPRAIRQPGGNRVFLQADKNGDVYAPFRLNIHDTKATWMSSLPHSWSNQVDARNNGHYNRWLEAKPSWKEEYNGMPLTLGYHNREDLPFYYALADAFTVCDHNFCSSLTGTTPNRLYFWTGTIRPSADAMAHVWNEDADYNRMIHWPSFPERLERHGVSWKVYQNEISVGTGLEGEHASWLANFTDNPLEFMEQYQVKLHPRYIAQLPITAARLEKLLEEKKSAQATGAEEEKRQKEISRIQEALLYNAAEQKTYTIGKWNQLSPAEKALHEKAFVTNDGDPHFHELDELVYMDGNTERRLQMPKGDILHQFREDVNNGKLPTVSWIVAPENFSDHPSAAWYGAWYISEVMDILTKNPEVWKKTVFILTYDENDGYFDHIPPFVAPNPANPESGKVSAGIDASVEFVANENQQSQKGRSARVSPIGLGYRVPMVIASPWSRGGWVNSQVFDHTSSLQFLEHFLSHKTGKTIKEENISAWRRAVCGDLRSAFRPWNGEKFATPDSLDRNKFLEGIHKAQFKKLPDNYYKLDALQVKAANENPHSLEAMPRQEKGIRPANALPYELSATGIVDPARKKFRLLLAAGKKSFGDRSAGAPFQVYSYGDYKGKMNSNRHYAVKAGDHVSDEWDIDGFPGGLYNIHVYGPNGFYTVYSGNAADPLFEVYIGHEGGAKPGNKLILQLQNKEKKALDIEIHHNAYGYANAGLRLAAAGNPKTSASLEMDLSGSHRWYDFTIRVKGSGLLKRFAGRLENGAESKTDPLMGEMG